MHNCNSDALPLELGQLGQSISQHQLIEKTQNSLCRTKKLKKTLKKFTFLHEKTKRKI